MRKLLLLLATLSISCGTLGVSAQPKSANSGEVEPLYRSTPYYKGMNGYSTFRIPAIVRTRGNVLLAFAEARRDGGGDSGDIDLVMRRSEDGGRSWGDMIVVWNDSNNTCGNPAPVVDYRNGRVVLVMTWNRGDDKETDIIKNRSRDTRRVYLCYSDDEGLSWSTPLEITQQAKLPEWGWYATGPCHSLQLRSKEARGRIVVPCDHSLQSDGNTIYNSHLIFSDDGGQSWQIGGVLKGGNESTIVECGDGHLLFNARWQIGDARFARHYARSYDSGESFGEVVRDATLIEPVCQGSIVGYSAKGKPTDKILFCNPASTKARKSLTLRVSYDAGRSWPKSLLVEDGKAAYSDVVVLKNSNVGVLFETGEKSPYERIDFVAIGKNLLR